MTSSSEKTFVDIVDSIKNLYRRYSLEDVATALFVSGLWLPNIASPVKHILFAATLCSMKPEEFAGTSTIKDYVEFQRFLNELYLLAPNFTQLEDCVPELDWGEVRFQLHKRKYRIFYGGDLSDVYDYLTLFQILYEPFDKKLEELTERSPMKELECVLTVQDAIIARISAQPLGGDIKVSAGDTSIPSEPFWRSSAHAYQSLDLADIAGTGFLTEFGTKLGELPSEILTREKLGEAAIDSRTFSTLFIQHEDRYFLILPRRMSGVLFDSWGQLLKSHQPSLTKDGSAELEVAGGFSRFVKERFSEQDAFRYVSARSGEREAHQVIFPAAIKSKDKLVLFYILPPATDELVLARKLAEVSPELKEALQLLQTPPTQLILHLESKRVEFRSDVSEKTLKPVLFIVVPQTRTGPFVVKPEEKLPGRLAFMDSVLAVLDELYEVEQLSDFIDYLETIEKSFVSPLTSLLDKFASFKDTDGVLVSGAYSPHTLIIDPHWGSQYRYESLANFWRLYPEEDFFGFPRSWQIVEEGSGRIRLVARPYFGSALHCEIGKAHVFLTAPFEPMSFEQRKTANFLMECAEDNLYQYRTIIAEHRAFERYQKLVVRIFPRSLVTTTPDFGYLRYLDPGTKPWCADARFVDTRSVCVKIVFNDEALRELFLHTQDRSVEVALLLEIVGQIDSICHDPRIKAITEVIENGKAGKPGFKLFTEQRQASFPEFVEPCLPCPRDFKLAKKRLAELAKQAGVSEGYYDLTTAKDRLNVLGRAMVTEINKMVAGFEFISSIPRLIGWADSVMHQRERQRITIKRSLEHHVEYRRDERYSENEEEFTRMHRNYRYLIEKFVQLQPDGKEAISEEPTRLLLALIDWFFVIRDASDVIHYDIVAAGLNIDHEFRAEVRYGADTEAKQNQFGQEEAQLRLGLIGNPKDALEHLKTVQERTAALDEAFRRDYRFRFTALITVLRVLTYWPEQHEGAVEAASYSATRDEIASAAQKADESLGVEEVDWILDFLTLKSEAILRVFGDERLCDDLPVWEQKKRFARYTIRPLIRLGQKYLWGPYAARCAGIIWSGSPFSGTLPADIGKTSINHLLQQWKRLLDNAVAAQASEIVKRFTTYTVRAARLHRLDRAGKHPQDLGDYDVLAYYPEAHAILSIECKNILPASCLKDAKTLREKIFGIPGKHEGHFRQIDKRQKHLMDHWAQIAHALGWPLSSAQSPRIISLYVTPTTYWWTRFPPRKVDTTFVRIEMLSKFIEDLRTL